MANARPRMRRGHQDAATAQESVTAKALSVLAAFEAGQSRLTLSAIARGAGLPVSTAQRLLRDLVEWGALERDGNLYTIGRRLWNLGMSAPLQRNIRDVAGPYMQDVFYATQQSVNLFVLDDGDALLVERVAGTRAGEPLRRVGQRLQLHASSAGKVLLAFGNADLFEKLPSQLAKVSPRTLATKDAVKLELEQVRAAGFAVSREETVLGRFAVAVPVLRPGLRAVAALGVINTGELPALGAIVPVLRSAANGIGRGLLHVDDAGSD